MYCLHVAGVVRPLVRPWSTVHYVHQLSITSTYAREQFMVYFQLVVRRVRPSIIVHCVSLSEGTSHGLSSARGDNKRRTIRCPLHRLMQWTGAAVYGLNVARRPLPSPTVRYARPRQRKEWRSIVSTWQEELDPYPWRQSVAGNGHGIFKPPETPFSRGLELSPENAEHWQGYSVVQYHN